MDQILIRKRILEDILIKPGRKVPRFLKDYALDIPQIINRRPNKALSRQNNYSILSKTLRIIEKNFKGEGSDYLIWQAKSVIKRSTGIVGLKNGIAFGIMSTSRDNKDILLERLLQIYKSLKFERI